jgi:hypothetical protein
MAARGGTLTNRNVPVPPSGLPDNIERIATNVRVEGFDTVHRRTSPDVAAPACGTYTAPHWRYVLTTAKRTCKRAGCARKDES